MSVALLWWQHFKSCKYTFIEGLYMGFELFGLKVWDFSQPFGYFEAFSGIFVVLFCAFVGFLILRHFRPKKFE